jgi:hypothetical protein
MSGAKHRRKGDRVEREIVALHEELGVHAERVPLSGASRYQDAGHDVDVYPFGTDECPFVFEVKARKGADGFRMLDRWLAGSEGLFLRPDRDKPLVVLSWDTWVRLLEEIKRCRPAPRKPPLAEILEKPAGAVAARNVRLTHRICPDGVVRQIPEGENHVGDANADSGGAGVAGGARPSRPSRPASVSSAVTDGPAPRPTRRVAPGKA